MPWLLEKHGRCGPNSTFGTTKLSNSGSSLQWRHMRVMTFQIIGYWTVCSTVRRGEQWKNIRAPASLTLCRGNPPVARGFPSQMASNAERVSMPWHPHEYGSPHCYATETMLLFWFRLYAVEPGLYRYLKSVTQLKRELLLDLIRTLVASKGKLALHDHGVSKGSVAGPECNVPRSKLHPIIVNRTYHPEAIAEAK